MLNSYDQLFAFFIILWHQHEEQSRELLVGSKVHCHHTPSKPGEGTEHCILNAGFLHRTQICAATCCPFAKVKEMMLFPVSHVTALASSFKGPAYLFNGHGQTGKKETDLSYTAVSNYLQQLASESKHTSLQPRTHPGLTIRRKQRLL